MYLCQQITNHSQSYNHKLPVNHSSSIVNNANMRKYYYSWQYWLWVVVLASITVASVSQSAFPPRKKQPIKRQWLFHCGGWGPGCMKTAPRTPPGLRIFSKHYNPEYRQALAESNGEFSPPFILTSGTSWGAGGKRNVASYNDNSLKQLITYILFSKTGFMYKELLYREMLRRFMERRMKEEMDVPQIE